jgi:glycosyltransferase involved in cell wall biosynthesis
LNIFVAIPAYDGKVCVETVRSLLNEQMVAAGAGVEFKAVFLPGCSLITHARNQMAQDFLDSEADRLVFIDADVSWEPGNLIRLAAHAVDFVGGAYRLKQETEAYPVGWLDEPELIAQDGLLEVASVPGGFLALSRKVFDDLKLEYPDRGYSHYQFNGHGYFHAPIQNGRLYGEDTAFCNDWRNIGGKVWLDPELTLTHVGGSNEYIGRIGDWLRTR